MPKAILSGVLLPTCRETSTFLYSVKDRLRLPGNQNFQEDIFRLQIVT